MRVLRVLTGKHSRHRRTIFDAVGLMAGKHSKRQRARAQVPVQRRAGIELVDALTRLAHLVTPDEMAAGHQRGDFVGFCGDRFQAACLVEPGRGPCQRCRERAVS